MKTASSQTTYQYKHWVHQFTHERPLLTSLILMLIGIGGILYFFFSLLPPPSMVTRERIKILEKHIRLHKIQNPRAQIELQNFKTISTEKISILDGWDRPILYRSISKNEHELTSYGEDGVPGGKPDFIYHFKI